MMERGNNYAAAAAAARKRFLSYDQRALAEKLGAKTDEDYFYCRLLSRRYRICRSTGDISKYRDGAWVDGNGFEETLTLLDLVCDSRSERRASGRWKSMGSFGGQIHRSLLERADPWAAYLQAHTAAFAAACQALNGLPFPQGDIAYALPLFEELSVAVQLWYGDEEFPATLRWLWDENALMYLKYETMYYAAALIREEIQARMEAAEFPTGAMLSTQGRG